VSEKKRLKCILLVDDDNDDNVYHQIILREMDVVEKIEVAANGIEALEYLRNNINALPELIFLDINMPKMNGWEFLREYKKTGIAANALIVVMILTTSANPDDVKRAQEIEEVFGFETKPLTEETMKMVLKEHFGWGN
jgi:CheY-like chemotaxis protein